MLLLVLEIYLGTFVNDQFIRPYAGNFLVTIFLYYLVRSFWPPPVGPALAGVLVLSYLIEISQYYHLVERIGLRHLRMAYLVLGSVFTWFDMLA